RGVAVVQRAGEGDHPDGGHDSSRRTTKSSITGLDRKPSAILVSVSSSTESSTSSSKCLPWRTSATPSNPRRGKAFATAWPCGSRISGLGMTSTTTRGTARAYLFADGGPSCRDGHPGYRLG